MTCEKLYEITIKMSLNKILLEYSHAHFFRYCLWLLSYYNMNSCNRDAIILIPNYVLAGPLQKIFFNP